MRHLLLTNDDGVDSPALPPFARALQQLADITVVVPDRQRSWIAKAISRSRDISTTTTEREGIPITACSGYPADATQLGVHVVCDPPPDVVISGINLGLNHGTAFILSSGTVGAAVEGWISGLPAIAFSTGVDGEHYASWRRHAGSPAAADQWAALAATSAQILRELWDARVWDEADVVTVNMPFDATPDTPRRMTSIARVRYGGLFDTVGPDRYRHTFVDVTEPDTLDGTDVGAFRDGVVSITPVRMPEAVELTPELRARLERPGGPT
ncbi:MAG TPA: 5'/3'-nucleotidase SurE [Euzebyales bacterium]|nr:5'/3'-nucleotidase SurE [Euzebyales bacterium]